MSLLRQSKATPAHNMWYKGTVRKNDPATTRVGTTKCFGLKSRQAFGLSPHPGGHLSRDSQNSPRGERFRAFITRERNGYTPPLENLDRPVLLLQGKGGVVRKQRQEKAPRKRTTQKKGKKGNVLGKEEKEKKIPCE